MSPTFQINTPPLVANTSCAANAFGEGMKYYKLYSNDVPIWNASGLLSDQITAYDFVVRRGRIHCFSKSSN